MARVAILWERIQPTLSAALDTTELGRLQAISSAARTAGCHLIWDVHNYAKYTDGGGVERTLGDGVLTQAHLVDLWTRMSTAFKSDSGVLAYGIMNEPQVAASPWETMSQAVVTGVRGNNDNKLIMVPGAGFSGAQSWPDTHPKAWITDAANNFRYEAHHYWDIDHSGDYGETYAATLANAVTAGF